MRVAEKRRTRRKRAESREFGRVDTSLVICKFVGGYIPLLGTVKLRVSVFTNPCCERIHEGESVPRPADSGVRTCKKDASWKGMETFACLADLAAMSQSSGCLFAGLCEHATGTGDEDEGVSFVPDCASGC